MNASARALIALIVAVVGCGQRAVTESARDASGLETSAAGDAAVDTIAFDANSVSDAESECGALGARCCVSLHCNGSLQCTNSTCACPEGATCVDGRVCTAAAPCTQTLASNQFLPSSVTANSTNVSWTNMGAGAYGSIVSKPLTGAAAVTLIANRLDPYDLAADTKNFYWVENQDNVLAMPLAGGAIATLEGAPVIAMTLDGDDLLWSTETTVMEGPKGGGAGRVIATVPFVASAVAADSGNIYWADSGEVMAVPKAGGSPFTIATNVAAQSLVAHAGRLFIATATGDIWSVPAGGGAISTLATGIAPAAPTFVLAVDDDFVFSASAGSGEANGIIAKTPIGGGTPVTISSSEIDASSIAVDSTSVYWTTSSEVKRRVPK